jgi:WD40 repeat protein
VSLLLYKIVHNYTDGSVVSIMDGDTREYQYTVKAHGGEIMDIAIYNNTVISCARDRTIQVFIKTNGAWALSQTLDEHTASVSKVLLLEDGHKLLSCSTDRTIVIRELCRRESVDGTVTDAYVATRTLSTKASPIHMAAMSDSGTTLLVSTLDRQIIKYDINTGKILSSFKVTDETGDAVVMDAITLSEVRGAPSKPKILLGTSTTDKSIRLYDLNGGLVDKEWGHTEGVSDVCLLEIEGKDPNDGLNVISTGTDGTIMIWDFGGSNQHSNQPNGLVDSPNLTPKDLTATRTPLRRVLSKTELLDFTPKGSPNPDISGSGSKSVGSTSPPRPLKKKTSLYGMNRPLSGVSKVGLGIQQQTQSQQQQPQSATLSDDSISPSTPVFTPAVLAGRESRKSIRDRTPSPPEAQGRLPPPQPIRRSSNDSRSRGKSDVGPVGNNNGGSGINNINGLAESLTRSLRSFRKKVEANRQPENTGVRPEVMKELQRELGLTLKDLSDSKNLEKTRNAGIADDDVMVAMLESYSTKLSSQLLSLVNDRLEGMFLKNEDGPSDINGTNNELDRRKTKTVDTTGEG